MATYPDLPVANPDECRMYISKDIPLHAAPDKARVYRYVRTNTGTIKLGMGVEKILEVTKEEIEKLHIAGAPVASYEWSYYPKKEALESIFECYRARSGIMRAEKYLKITSHHLDGLIPDEFMLAALVDVIDPVRRVEDRYGKAPEWVDAYRAGNTDSEFQLGDLGFGDARIAMQFLNGDNRTNGLLDQWFVDIDPMLERVA